MYVTIASLESKVLKYILRWVIRSILKEYLKKKCFLWFSSWYESSDRALLKKYINSRHWVMKGIFFQ